MATPKPRASSFSRNIPSTAASQVPGVKGGPNGTLFLSSGISDLDSKFPVLCYVEDIALRALYSVLIAYNFLLWSKFSEILGGGFPLGSLVVVMEDPEAPHHMLLLRNFMSQGLVHNQPLLYASPAKDPRGFLGTLPSPVSSKDNKSLNRESEQVPPFFTLW